MPEHLIWTAFALAIAGAILIVIQLYRASAAGDHKQVEMAAASLHIAAAVLVLATTRLLGIESGVVALVVPVISAVLSVRGMILLWRAKSA
jgi:uncharacterized membrane protein